MLEAIVGSRFPISERSEHGFILFVCSHKILGLTYVRATVQFSGSIPSLKVETGVPCLNLQTAS